MGIATLRWADSKITQTIDGNWTGTRAWDVISFSDEDDAVNSTGTFAGQEHPLVSSLICTSIGIVENKLSYAKVLANYAITSLVDTPVEPTARAPTIQWRRGSQSLAVDTDINGNPILNSALDAYRSAFSREFIVRFLRITQWETVYDQSRADQYELCVNSMPVTFQGITYQPGQMRLNAYAPVEEYQENATYVRCAYDFEIRTPNTPGLTALQKRHPFQRRMLDQGLRGTFNDPNNSNAPTLGNFWLGGGSPQQVTRDVLLNGSGQPIDSTIKVTANLYAAQARTIPTTVLVDSTANARFLIFQDYAEADLTHLPIRG